MFVMGHSSFTQVCPHHISSWSHIVCKCSRFSIWQLPHPCPRWCWRGLKGCSDGSEGSRSTRSWPCHLVIWGQIQWGASDMSLGPPPSFALIRCGGISQSLSGKSTNRAAFLINCPSTVIPVFFPPVPPSLAGSSQCCEPQRQSAQCCQLNLQQGLLEISGAFALLQEAPRDEDFAALWCRAGCVGLCSSGIFFVQVVCAVCVFLGIARAWQVSLHRALASPKQPLSSSVRLSCQLLLLSWGNPTDGCRGQMQVLYITENPVQQLRFGAASPSLGSSSCRGKLLTAAGAVSSVCTRSLSLQCGASNVFFSSLFQGCDT